MAAEIIGTTVGVVGFLGQLFDGCVKAYGYFSAASHLDADSQRLLCKVRIEEMRLVVWGREWGVKEGRFEAHLSGHASVSGGGGDDDDGGMMGRGGNLGLRSLATQILEELHGTVTDFAKLKETYGLAAASPSSSSSAAVDGDGDGGATGEKKKKNKKKKGDGDGGFGGGKGGEAGKGGEVGNGLKRNERGWRKELELRTRWVIADKEKFTKLLTDLKDFNDGLERLFPPSQVPSLRRAWTHQLLDSASRDVGQLSLLETASSGTYPRLTGAAGLKRLRINLDAAPQAGFRPTYALKVGMSALTILPPPAPDHSSISPPPPQPPRSPRPDGGSSRKKPPRSPDPNASTESFRASTPNLTPPNPNPHDPSAPTPNNAGATTKRSAAVHAAEGDVFVEWIEYEPQDLDARLSHLRRIDDLARMTRSATSAHPDLRGVDCLGYADDAAHSRYGLVYRCPSPSTGPSTGTSTGASTGVVFSTLHDAIASPDLSTPDLDDRVRLARLLAVATWSLHSLDWLHKSICSANVLFFSSPSTSPSSTSSSSAPDISSPYLAGFDASRPSLDDSLSLAPRNPSIPPLHRHPSSLRGLPHSKAFDVYSLGLLLLEVGLWKVLGPYHRPHYSPERWRDRVVLAVLVPGLGSKMGKRYRDVVRMCLTVGDDLTSHEANQLMETVVTKLESIHL